MEILGTGGNEEPNSIRMPDAMVRRQPRSNYDQQHSYLGTNNSAYDNLSFDALFGSHYDSEKDEDYDEKEDMIQNTKTYYDDRKPIHFNISKAEVQYLL